MGIQLRMFFKQQVLLMCGRFNVNDDSNVQYLLDRLEVINPDKQRHDPFIMPCQSVSIVIEQQSQRVIKPATWWLLLDANEQGFKPSKYTSFNTRFDQVNIHGSAGYLPFRQQRCIIPASGFGETMFINKRPLMYHDLMSPDRAIAFAGLYNTWQHQQTGELSYSCSIITNAPHIKLAQIHTKASPAMLTADKYDQWLDPALQDVSVFSEVLKPRIITDFVAQRINKPSLRQPVATSFMITADK